MYTYRAGERLDAWRDEARHLQGKQNVSVCINGPVRYQRAEEKAPFATSGAETKSQELLSLSLVTSKLKVTLHVHEYPLQLPIIVLLLFYKSTCISIGRRRSSKVLFH